MSNGRFCRFDMDGTLFDYDSAMKKSLLEVTPDEWHDWIGNCEDIHKFGDHGDWARNLIDLIRRDPGWWRELPRLQAGWDIYEVAKEIGFCCHILTKGPSSKPIAWAEKVECIAKHFGDGMSIDIVGDWDSKGNMYSRVLVEDYPTYLKAFLDNRPRGLGILIDHPYNKSFIHENCVRYRGDNIEEVRAALQAAYDRKSKQHWKELLYDRRQSEQAN